MEKEPGVEVNPRIMMGKPVIKGTRIRVELILERLALGETISDLLIAYPHLRETDIKNILKK
ncbi:MAG: DUF433 domain-containing protein [Cyclobacteriaceae bacterium]|nr:DUF433 domain-containing protein [Flammeovirgaceae bacterium]